MKFAKKIAISSISTVKISHICLQYNCCGFDAFTDWLKKHKEIPGSCCKKQFSNTCPLDSVISVSGCRRIIHEHIEQTAAYLPHVFSLIFILEVWVIETFPRPSSFQKWIIPPFSSGNLICQFCLGRYKFWKFRVQKSAPSDDQWNIRLSGRRWYPFRRKRRYSQIIKSLILIVRIFNIFFFFIKSYWLKPDSILEWIPKILENL